MIKCKGSLFYDELLCLTITKNVGHVGDASLFFVKIHG